PCCLCRSICRAPRWYHHRDAPESPLPNHLSDVLAFLNRRLSDTRKSVERHHVTDCEDFRMAGQGAVGLHRDSTRPVRLGTGGAGQHSGQGRCLHTGRPYLCSRGMRSSPSPLLTVILSSSIAIAIVPQRTSTPIRSSRSCV